MTGYNTEQSLEYYHSVSRAKMITYLGGVCAQCGTAEDLQIDHIDPSTKSFNIKASMSMKRPEVIAELAKCQLLCRTHHIEKTARENSGYRHGTIYAWMKKKCQCSTCCIARRAWHDERNATRRHGGPRGPYKPRRSKVTP